MRGNKVSKLSFKSKAQNLLTLQPLLKNAIVLPLYVITKNVLASSQAKEIIIDNIQSLDSKKIIIRSSSKNEDSMHTSNAGAFLSIANVDSNNIQEIMESLQKVADTMPNQDDEILIQPMLENILLCGVACSVDKDNFAPYFCIQYDTSGRHDGITDGSSKEIQSYVHYRFTKKMPQDRRLANIISMIQEIEKLYKIHYLDIEFAIAVVNNTEKLYCLQVRPLVMNNKINLYDSLPPSAIERLYKRFQKVCEPKPHILGRKAIFGVMPDWNPAEIIGLRPKRLALSLYKEIITDDIWAYQRDNYGYRNLRSHPLMHSFLGIPYIDVRASFNSFIPKNLNEKIAEKLCNYYLTNLVNMPELHDKVEFQILFSCYDFNISTKLQKLLDCGFNANEIKRIEFSLLELTNSIINPQTGLYLKDIAKIQKLMQYFKHIQRANYSLIDKIYWLIEELKRYGTLPFAGVARAGFVAMTMLNSLVEIGFFTPLLKEEFLYSLNTVSKKLSMQTTHLNAKTKARFLKEFGHLRAGSYDITSPRYDEAFEKYFTYNNPQTTISLKAFKLRNSQMNALNTLLTENGLHSNGKDFLLFLKTAIEGREYVKFEFSKVLSYVLMLIGELGRHYDIDKEDMAHLDIKNILSLYSSVYSTSPKSRLLDDIQKHKEEYNLTLSLKLPPLLTDATQIYGFSTQRTLANFITQKHITASVAREDEVDIEGKIVCIYAADPGYDYLFSKNIAGFITCYGGANSHMAIRASELGLPAVIGVGEESFKKYREANMLMIDCESEQICVIGLT